MATATGFVPFNLEQQQVGEGEVTIFTSTHIQVVDGAEVTNYFGFGFSFDPFTGFLNGGTLTWMNALSAGVLQFEITGLNHSMVTLNNYLLNDDLLGALGFLFNGNDTINGSSGNDVFSGFDGDDILFDNNGDDVGRGNAGNDVFYNGEGNDIAFGGSGDDIFYDGAGNDAAFGGAGTDIVVLSGLAEDYELRSLAGSRRLIDLKISDGDDGANAIGGVEIGRFSDRDIAISEKPQQLAVSTCRPWGAPSTATLSDGSFVVVWWTDDQDSQGVFGQRFDVFGEKIGTEFQINTYTTGTQASPTVAALKQGGFVVTWTSWGQDGSGAGVYGQRYDSTGSPAGAEFTINTYTTSDQSTPDVVGLAGGGFVVAWTSSGQDGSGTGVYGQRYDATGNAIGGEFRINTTTSGDQSMRSVAELANGGFVVVWYDGSLYGQRFGAAGNAEGDQFKINLWSNLDLLSNPAVVVGLSNGGFAAIWQTYFFDDPSYTSAYGIAGRIYDESGNPLGPDFVINAYTPGDQRSPSAAALPDGRFVVTWISTSQDAGKPGIYGQLIDGLGGRLESDFKVHLDPLDVLLGALPTPRVSALSDGGFLVAWDLGGPAGWPNMGVVGQRFDGDANPLGMPVVTGTDNADILRGGLGSQELLGLAGDDTLYGGSGSDTIDGGLGNDTMDGGAGPDLMNGWEGDDTYVVDDVGDVVTENMAEGTDAVQSSVNFVLPANVENLFLLGGGDIDGGGNAQANVIVGNLGVNALAGGAGDDVYFVQTAGDTVAENPAEGVDTVFSTVSFALGANVEHLTLSGAAAIDGTGNGLDNTLVGNDGVNVLSGGAGNDTYVLQTAGDTVMENPGEGADIVTSSVDFTLPDNVEHIFLLGFGNLNATGNAAANVMVGNLGTNTLTGGLGDDIYFVQAPNATVVENAAAGHETVFAYVSFTLPANVEDLFLQGGGAIDGTGNELNNILLGNDAVNVLTGGAGDDIYFVQNAGDTVVENPGEGSDTVFSTVSFTLGADLEHVTLTGSADVDATGNAMNNTLVGNDGVNVLTGGAGNDTYVVQTAGDTVVENPGEGVDIITSSVDFTLPATVEHMFLLGLGNVNATGNDLQNVLVGNLGTNTLTGGLGDDIYFVQAPNATVVENADEGRDTVFAYLNFTLSDNVEDLYLEGTDPLNGTGNALNNVLRGNSAANVLTPGAGTDILIGAGDDDTFVFDAASGMNRIVDFADGAGGEEDTVNLAAFGTNFGSLNFTVEAGGVAMTVAGVADFSVFFEGYAATANFGADDFMLV